MLASQVLHVAPVSWIETMVTQKSKQWLNPPRNAKYWWMLEVLVCPTGALDERQPAGYIGLIMNFISEIFSDDDGGLVNIKC